MTNPYAASSSGQADRTTAYITTQLQRGASRDTILRALVQDGWTAGDAEAAVSSAEAGVRRQTGRMTTAGYDTRVETGTPAGPQTTQNPRAAGNRSPMQHIVFGGLWCAGGIIASVLSYQLTAPGGIYFVYTGAIVFGTIEFCYGLFTWLSTK